MIQGITMPSVKKVKNCDLLINCSSCTQEKYNGSIIIGLKESKTFESRGKTSWLFNFFMGIQLLQWA